MKDNFHSKDNVYAFNIKDEIKHISEVESGRKGYYCMGCKRDMQARKGEILTHHFSHDPKDTMNKGKCTFSDETYRHKLAKDILQRIKEIKVPTIYKYPPKDIEGSPFKVKDSYTVFAHTVRNEITFYENENGDVAFGRNIDFEKDKSKHLLIKPDVAFFDSNDKPILLIEIVATHKIEPDKLSKITRLGIDTVQVIVPKDSPEEIENTFYKTNRTNWIYSYEQEQTPYIQPSERSNEGILLIDEFQRKLLKTVESYNCRASQLGNVIRAITKSMESESHREFEQHLRSEIQRVEENTERNRRELRDIEEKYKSELSEEFRNEEEELRKRRDIFNREEADLEARYIRKRDELIDAQKEYRFSREFEITRIERDFEKLGANPISGEEQLRQVRRKEEELQSDFANEERTIDIESNGLASKITNIVQRRRNLSSIYTEIETRIREEFEKEGRRIFEKFESEEARVREEFDRDTRESIETIENKDCQRIPRISRRIEEIINGGRFTVSITEGRNSIKTYERAKELFDTGAYKSWV